MSVYTCEECVVAVPPDYCQKRTRFLKTQVFTFYSNIRNIDFHATNRSVLPWIGDSERGGVPTTGDSGSYGGGGGEDGDGVGECGCLESRSGSRSRILRTV